MKPSFEHRYSTIAIKNYLKALKKLQRDLLNVVLFSGVVSFDQGDDLLPRIQALQPCLQSAIDYIEWLLLDMHTQYTSTESINILIYNFILAFI